MDPLKLDAARDRAAHPRALSFLYNDKALRRLAADALDTDLDMLRKLMID